MPVRVFTIVVFSFYALVFAACFLTALFPKWCWKTFDSWKAVKEPSKAYFLRKRIEGVIGMVVITAIAAAPLLAAYFDR